MNHKLARLSTTRSEKIELDHARSVTPKPAARPSPAMFREEQLDVEAALSPFWAWRITSH